MTEGPLPLSDSKAAGAALQSSDSVRQAAAPRGRTLSKVLLVLYLACLLWLTLFKLSYEIASILADYQTRSLSLIPFATLGQTGLSETVSNVVTFVPFGLLLGVVFKQTAGWRLLCVMFGFSLAVETLQFVLAIGTTDTTDVVTNTFGGLAGLALYRLLDKIISTTILDRVITVIGLVFFVAFLGLRVLVFQVRY